MSQFDFLFFFILFLFFFFVYFLLVLVWNLAHPFHALLQTLAANGVFYFLFCFLFSTSFFFPRFLELCIYFYNYVFLLPEANVCMCTFWVHPSNWWVILKSTHLLVGLFSKYECWVTDLFMPLYHFIFFELSLAFL
jgi:hypothetical protein